jgi:hypothetical protein
MECTRLTTPDDGALQSRELLCSPNVNAEALTGIPHAYECHGAVWLALTGGIADSPASRVTALHVYNGLALLTLDNGALVLMQRQDIDPTVLATLAAA